VDFGLAGRVALVTGASKGIGRATALELAAEGCNVALVARSKSTLDDTAAEVAATGVRAMGVSADMSTPAAPGEIARQIESEFGGLDVLVNVLGADEFMQTHGSIETISDEVWTRSLDVGVMGHVRMCRAAIPLLRRSEQGRIITVAAMSIRHQFPPLIAYTAAKAAVTSMTKNLAKTLAPEGITANTVCPGLTLSEGLLDAIGATEGDFTSRAAVAEQVVAEMGLAPDLGRGGRTEEVAAMIAFLASRRASYVTGATINVDGGTDF
jgi:NAD(P)-dependent dehydrogenase (short-subunit alcohol dehydrogenase family)